MHPVYPSIRSRIVRILNAEFDPDARAALRLARSPIPDVDLCFHLSDRLVRERLLGLGGASPEIDAVSVVGEFVTVRVANDALTEGVVAIAEGRSGPTPPAARRATLAPAPHATDAEWSRRVSGVTAAWAALLQAAGVVVDIDPAVPGDPAVTRTGDPGDPLTAPRRVAVAGAGGPDHPMEAVRHSLALLQSPPWRKATPRVVPRPWSGGDLPDRLARLGSMVRYGSRGARSETQLSDARRLVAGRERALVLRLLSAADVVEAAARTGDPSRTVREAGVVLRALDEYYPGFRFMTDDGELQRGRAILARATEATARAHLHSVGVSSTTRHREDRGET
jgi:hypothetical protein